MASAQAEAPEATVSNLLPYGGWLLALFLAIWIAQQFFGRFFQELGTRFTTLIVKIFGSRTLGKRALGNYRHAILRNYGKHPLGFRKEGTVNVQDIYVPLQYVDDESHRNDVAEAISMEDNVVILGEPGAGKSLLMKHTLIAWASLKSAQATRNIPVLVELHRCNSQDVTLIGLIREEFERNGVRGRPGMAERALGDRRLLILFDGLDEVARDNQARVSTMIKDFVTTWNGCKFIATCRIAVYTGQLLPNFSATVSIADFDDAGIRRLLAKWQGLDAEEADRFFGGLAESAQLMRLAGSPLLLTMMVYLQTEVFAKTGRTLPGSRTAFYEVAVDHLLRRDRDLARDDSLAIYESADKRAALQRIALILQQAPPEQPDRRSIERVQLIETVMQLARNLNLRDQDVSPLIREIVERSQLLVELDNRSTRYAFRHLTLQEFLAAAELRNDTQQLMRAYRLDHDGWRETVRMWCGLTSLDCTVVVEEIFGGDEQQKVLALQCVADATNINPGLAERIIEYFIGLVTSGMSNRAVESALGSVASDNRPRGEYVLSRLKELFLSEGPGHAGLARALAATRRTAAAQTLGARIVVDHSARSAMRTMGEQAIPVFRTAAAAGDINSVNDLGEIATTSAANSLMTLIWADDAVAHLAAWWIASLIRNPDVQNGILPTQPTGPAPSLDWVWRPFAPKNHDLMVAMGRVAWLLTHCPTDDATPSLTIDHRVGIPLVALRDGTGAIPTAESGVTGIGRRLLNLRRYHHEVDFSRFSAATEEAMHVIRESYTTETNSPRYAAEIIAIIRRDDPDVASAATDAILSQAGVQPNIRRVFFSLPTVLQYQLINDGIFFFPSHRLTVKQWSEARARLDGPRHLISALLVWLLFTGAVLVCASAYRGLGSWLGADVGGPDWLNLSARFGLGIVVCGGLAYYLSEVVFSSDNSFVDALIEVSDYLLDDLSWLLFTLMVPAVMICLTSAVLGLHDFLEWSWIAAIIVCAIAAVSMLWFLRKRVREQMMNPFRVYLGADLPEMAKRMDLRLEDVSERISIQRARVPNDGKLQV